MVSDTVSRQGQSVPTSWQSLHRQIRAARRGARRGIGSRGSAEVAAAACCVVDARVAPEQQREGADDEDEDEECDCHGFSVPSRYY